MFWKKPSTTEQLIERVKKLEKIMGDEKKRVITIYDSDVTNALRRLDALEKQLSDVSSGQLGELKSALSSAELMIGHGEYNSTISAYCILRNAVREVITASAKGD